MKETFQVKSMAHLSAILAEYLDKRSRSVRYGRRNYEILHQCIAGIPLRQIADNYGLTATAIRNIARHELVKLEAKIEYDNYSTLQQRYDKLERDYEILAYKYSTLEKVAKKRLSIRTSDGHKIDEDTMNVLRQRLIDFNLSIRALNCLRSAGIDYMWQLVLFDKSELMKTRNFGKKTLRELEELVDSLGLAWGINYQELLNTQTNGTE